MITERTLEGWIKKSFVLPRISTNHLLLYNFQSIGVLDTTLSKEWAEIKNHLTEEKYIVKFSQHSFISSLLVMGSYEMMRVLKKYDSSKRIKNAYELFRRVRVPMVKFQAPQTNGIADYENDFGIAHAAIGKITNDLGWAVSPQDFISREDLANELYNLY